MATAPNSFSKAGFHSAQYSARTPAGVLTGAADLDVSDTGESSNMARLIGALNTDIVFPEPALIPSLGDDSVMCVHQFDPATPLQFRYQTNVHNLAFKAWVSGTEVVTEAEQVMLPIGARGAKKPGVVFMMTAEIKGLDSAAVGVDGYVHLLLFNTEWHDRGIGAFAHQALNAGEFVVTANETDTLPDGRSIASVFPSVPNGRCVGLMFTSENLCSFASFVGDAAEDDIEVQHKPISATKVKATVESTTWGSGTVSSVTTTSPYSIKLNAAPGSGKRAVLRYEFTNYAA